MIALILSVLMVTSFTSCSVIRSIISGGGDSGRSSRDRDDDDDDDDDEDKPSKNPSKRPITPQGLPDLTYPDHVATVDEIHPDHARGTVTGAAATAVLNEVETAIIQNSIDNYVDATLLFEHPENFGIELDEVTWGEIDTDTDEIRDFYQEQLDKVLTVDRESLGLDDKKFYDKVVWDLEESLYAVQYSAFNYYESILNPLVGPQTDLLFVLDLFTFNTVEEAENYLLLLNDIDRYYDDICDYEEEKASYGYPLSTELYEQIAESFDSLVEMTDDCFLYDSFETKLDNIPNLSSQQKQDLISRHDTVMHDVVFPEFQECSDRMNALASEGYTYEGIAEYEMSQDYYSSICRRMSNSAKTPDTLADELDARIRSLMAEQSRIVYSGSTSWYAPYLAHDYSVGTLQQNLDFLKSSIVNDFPALHAHEYFTSEVPEPLEDNFSPAAYFGYHLDNYNSNMILVNNSKLDEDYGVTVAHEGYPGHMFQSVYTRSIAQHPYMYLCASIGYKEGWADYCERYAMKYYDSNATVRTLVQIDDELNSLIGGRCDIGINYEGWDQQDCADYLTDALGRPFTTSDVESMYNLLISDPGYAVKYASGYINTLLVMETAHTQFPNASDLEIHTAYLDAMTGTFEQIESYMLEDLAN